MIKMLKSIAETLFSLFVFAGIAFSFYTNGSFPEKFSKVVSSVDSLRRDMDVAIANSEKRTVDSVVSKLKVEMDKLQKENNELVARYEILEKRYRRNQGYSIPHKEHRPKHGVNLFKVAAEKKAQFGESSYTLWLPLPGSMNEGTRTKIIADLLRGEGHLDSAEMFPSKMQRYVERLVKSEIDNATSSCMRLAKEDSAGWTYDDGTYAATLRYDNKTKLNLLHEGKNWVTFKKETISYGAGAAHGGEHNEYRTYSKEDGEVLDKSIFVPGYKKELVLLLQEFGAPKAQDFEAINEENIPDPYLTDTGIAFNYGTYMIDCGAAGNIEIVVPYDEILGMVHRSVKKKMGLPL